MILGKSYKVVIVEDVQSSQAYLKNLLTIKFPSIKIVAIEDNVPGAISAIDHFCPDLIFLDVEIKAGSGMDVLAGIKNKDPYIIFTTVFDQYAVDAFRYNSIDYILKPLDDEKVIYSVNRFFEKIEPGQPSLEISALTDYIKRQSQMRLPVSTVFGLEFVDMEEILFVEAYGNYSDLKLRSGRHILVTKKIKELEDFLTEPMFVRTHKSYLINTRYIQKYYKGRGGYIVLDDTSSIPIAPSRKNHFLKIFQCQVSE